jgi:hypothetical protein
MTDKPYRHPRRIRRLLESLVPIVCPPATAELGLAQDIVARVEASMQALPVHLRAGLLAGLSAYEAGALADPRHLGRPASALPKDRGVRYFERWWHSPLAPQRELAKGVKGLLCLACYETPEMKSSIGYTPEAWIERVTAQRLVRHAETIRRREHELLRPEPLPRREPA